ncbi:UNVERIFIED_CONTAM: hypothetical protein K2H54_042604 [Gekko kuhli]
MDHWTNLGLYSILHKVSLEYFKTCVFITGNVSSLFPFTHPQDLKSLVCYRPIKNIFLKITLCTFIQVFISIRSSLYFKVKCNVWNACLQIKRKYNFSSKLNK